MNYPDIHSDNWDEKKKIGYIFLKQAHTMSEDDVQEQITTDEVQQAFQRSNFPSDLKKRESGTFRAYSEYTQGLALREEKEKEKALEEALEKEKALKKKLKKEKKEKKKALEQKPIKGNNQQSGVRARETRSLLELSIKAMVRSSGRNFRCCC